MIHLAQGDPFNVFFALRWNSEKRKIQLIVGNKIIDQRIIANKGSMSS